MRAERHPSEAERIAALHRYRILDTPREADFDELVSLVGRICETPLALITLLDEDRQWFKSAVGTEITQRPYDESLCSHAILQPDLLEVPDLTKDPRFADNGVVTGEMGLRFYAGVPLLTPEGLPLGTLCVLDTRPRELTELQRETLRVMARQTMTALELRRRAAEATEERARVDETLGLAMVATWAWDSGSDLVQSNPVLRRFFGIPEDQQSHLPLFDFLLAIHPNDREQVSAAIARSVETGASYETEYRVLDDAGHERWVIARGSMIAGTQTLSGVLVDITANKAAEAEREQLYAQIELERARLERMYAESPAFIAVLYGPDLVYGYANEPYYQLIGHREIIGKPLAVALPEVVDQGFPESLRRVMETGEIWSIGETPCLLQRKPDGPLEERTLTLKFLPVYEADGTISGVYAHGIDVTESVLARQELARERQQFRQLLDEVPAHVVTLRGPELHYEFANRAFLEFLGKTDDFLGQSLEEAWPVPAEHVTFLKEIMANGNPVQGTEVSVPVPDWPGREAYFDFIFQPLREADGAVSGVFVHSQDVTEKVLARRRIAEGEERFRMVAQATRDAVWDCDLRTGNIWWNEGIADLFGYDTYASTSEWWISRIHDEDRDRVMAGIERVIEEGKTRWADEYRFLKADGSYVIVEDRGFAIFDAEKKAIRMVGAMADVTESRLAQRRLETMVADRTAELREAVKEAESFNYSISHDLRTPLRAISSTSDILLEEAGPELGSYHRELLERQSHNSRRLGLLIDQLLRLSRLGRVEMLRSRLNVTAIAQAVAAEISQADGDAGCMIEVQPGMSAEGDSALVRLVLSNLIENACKFSSGQGTVRVRQDGAIFSVIDEGVGFDMRYAKKLFLPFERLVKDTDFPGTGIGLANVERIIRRHNGRVWAESEPGKGATFFFTLGE